MNSKFKKMAKRVLSLTLVVTMALGLFIMTDFVQDKSVDSESFAAEFTSKNYSENYTIPNNIFGRTLSDVSTTDLKKYSIDGNDWYLLNKGNGTITFIDTDANVGGAITSTFAEISSSSSSESFSNGTYTSYNSNTGNYDEKTYPSGVNNYKTCTANTQALLNKVANFKDSTIGDMIIKNNTTFNIKHNDDIAVYKAHVTVKDRSGSSILTYYNSYESQRDYESFTETGSLSNSLYRIPTYEEITNNPTVSGAITETWTQKRVFNTSPYSSYTNDYSQCSSCYDYHTVLRYREKDNSTTAHSGNTGLAIGDYLTYTNKGQKLYSTSVGVCPAFTVNIKDFLIKKNKSSGTDSTELTPVSVSGGVAELLNHSGNKILKVSAEKAPSFATSIKNQELTNVVLGGTYKFSYENAVTTSLNGSEDLNYISAIIYDENGNIRYYGNLAGITKAKGTTQITIPSDLTVNSTYYLAVFEEEKAAAGTDDVASPLAVSKFTVVGTAGEGDIINASDYPSTDTNTADVPAAYLLTRDEFSSYAATAKDSETFTAVETVKSGNTVTQSEYELSPAIKDIDETEHETLTVTDDGDGFFHFVAVHVPTNTNKGDFYIRKYSILINHADTINSIEYTRDGVSINDTIKPEMFTVNATFMNGMTGTVDSADNSYVVPKRLWKDDITLDEIKALSEFGGGKKIKLTADELKTSDDPDSYSLVYVIYPENASAGGPEFKARYTKEFKLPLQSVFVNEFKAEYAGTSIQYGSAVTPEDFIGTTIHSDGDQTEEVITNFNIMLKDTWDNTSDDVKKDESKVQAVEGTNAIMIPGKAECNGDRGVTVSAIYYDSSETYEMSKNGTLGNGCRYFEYTVFVPFEEYVEDTYQNWTKSGIIWRYHLDENGNATDVYTASEVNQIIDENGCMNIPEKIAGHPVVSIGSGLRDNPFILASIDSYIKINFPSSLRKINDYAFYMNNATAQIDIPENVTGIGKFAFYDCNNILTLSTHGADIGSVAFGGCDGLQQVSVDGGEIGMAAFAECRVLDKITVSGDTVIGKAAFANLKTVTSLNLKNLGSDSEIKTQAFMGMSRIKEVHIPHVKRVAAYAFNNCANLENVELDYPTVVNNTFAGCPKIKNLIFGQSVEMVEYDWGGHTTEQYPSETYTDVIDTTIYVKGGYTVFQSYRKNGEFYSSLMGHYIPGGSCKYARKIKLYIPGVSSRIHEEEETLVSATANYYVSNWENPVPTDTEYTYGQYLQANGLLAVTSGNDPDINNKTVDLPHNRDGIIVYYEGQIYDNADVNKNRIKALPTYSDGVEGTELISSSSFYVYDEEEVDAAIRAYIEEVDYELGSVITLGPDTTKYTYSEYKNFYNSGVISEEEFNAEVNAMINEIIADDDLVITVLKDEDYRIANTLGRNPDVCDTAVYSVSEYKAFLGSSKITQDEYNLEISSMKEKVKKDRTTMETIADTLAYANDEGETYGQIYNSFHVSESIDEETYNTKMNALIAKLAADDAALVSGLEAIDYELGCVFGRDPGVEYTAKAYSYEEYEEFLSRGLVNQSEFNGQTALLISSLKSNTGTVKAWAQDENYAAVNVTGEELRDSSWYGASHPYSNYVEKYESGKISADELEAQTKAMVKDVFDDKTVFLAATKDCIDHPEIRKLSEEEQYYLKDLKFIFFTEDGPDHEGEIHHYVIPFKAKVMKYSLEQEFKDRGYDYEKVMKEIKEKEEELAGINEKIEKANQDAEAAQKLVTDAEQSLKKITDEYNEIIKELSEYIDITKPDDNGYTGIKTETDPDTGETVQKPIVWIDGKEFEYDGSGVEGHVPGDIVATCPAIIGGEQKETNVYETTGDLNGDGVDETFRYYVDDSGAHVIEVNGKADDPLVGDYRVEDLPLIKREQADGVVNGEKKKVDVYVGHGDIDGDGEEEEFKFFVDDEGVHIIEVDGDKNDPNVGLHKETLATMQKRLIAQIAELRTSLEETFTALKKVSGHLKDTMLILDLAGLDSFDAISAEEFDRLSIEKQAEYIRNYVNALSNEYKKMTVSYGAIEQKAKDYNKAFDNIFYSVFREGEAHYGSAGKGAEAVISEIQKQKDNNATLNLQILQLQARLKELGASIENLVPDAEYKMYINNAIYDKNDGKVVSLKSDIDSLSLDPDGYTDSVEDYVLIFHDGTKVMVIGTPSRGSMRIRIANRGESEAPEALFNKIVELIGLAGAKTSLEEKNEATAALQGQIADLLERIAEDDTTSFSGYTEELMAAFRSVSALRTELRNTQEELDTLKAMNGDITSLLDQLRAALGSDADGKTFTQMLSMIGDMKKKIDEMDTLLAAEYDRGYATGFADGKNQGGSLSGSYDEGYAAGYSKGKSEAKTEYVYVNSGSGSGSSSTPTTLAGYSATQITSMATENKSLKETNTTLTAQVTALEEDVAELEASNSKLTTTNKTLNKKNKTLNKKVKNITGDKTELKAANKKLLTTAKTLQVKNKSLQTQNSALIAKNNALTTENSSLKAQIANPGRTTEPDVPSEPGVPTEPDETPEPETHKPVKEWKSDKTSHWYECDDGCGKQYKLGEHEWNEENFCTVCGAFNENGPDPIPSATPTVAPVIPSNVPATNEPVETPEPTESPAPEPGPEGGIPVTIFIIGGIILAIVAVGLIYVFGGKKKAKKTEEAMEDTDDIEIEEDDGDGTEESNEKADSGEEYGEDEFEEEDEDFE